MSETLTLVGFSAISFIAATVATLMGFGIGTSLTPFFALAYPTHIAVMLVAVVHFLSNLLRLTLFRHHMDLALVRRFGILSIVGALGGAFAQGFIQSDWLKVALGVLLVLVGVSALLPNGSGWHFPRRFDQAGGLISGALGGLLGNQGAVRGAYLANYDIPKESFIATAALIAVFIDSTRIPIYVATQWEQLVLAWPVLLSATISAYIGTYVGQKLVGRVSQESFKQLVNAMIAVFGLVMIAQGTWTAAGEMPAIAVSTLVALGLLLAVLTWKGGRKKLPRLDQRSKRGV
ncbi:MAG: sulfite exporter TauE/SafE family protein [Chloroflexi bacterium]|nr:sulfite exporter TauE/SafE family protein [Chloroflexota bacterium]